MKFKRSAQHAFAIISIVALIAALQFLGIFFSSSAFARVPVKIFSTTRGVFDTETGEMLPQATPLPIADALLDLDEQGCPGEIMAYVHGVWSNETSALEQAEKVALSIDANNYDTLVIGFSWDSDTEVSPVGWGIAKIIANGNGSPLLAKIILDYKDHCPDDKIRVASHSLGARVVLSALQTLAENTTNNNNSDWSRNGFKIISVHLMGAAVDDEQVSMDSNPCNENRPSLPCSGGAIESEVETFYNLVNAEDNLLQFTYYQHESDYALAHLGSEDMTQDPANYVEYGVLHHIPPVWDADGNGEDNCYDAYVFQWGDNHCGYMGFRNLGGTFWDAWKDEAIEEVVIDWTRNNGTNSGGINNLSS